MQFKNKVIIAAAGSGKTTYLVNETVKRNSSRVLIVTFTNKNAEEIKKKFIQLIGFIPANVDIKTWYSFLLSDCIRPYQNTIYPDNRIEAVFFRDRPANWRIKKSNIKGYYLNQQNQIDKDRLSDFAFQCFAENNGRVIKRLEEIYDHLFIDEVQDMSGYDLELFKIFFQSSMRTVLVGDIRQATYTTSNTNKNQKFRGINIIDFFIKEEQQGNCKLEYLYESHRCNQHICDFADNLFSHLPGTKSLNIEETEHDGIYVLQSEHVPSYIEKYRPQLLRYDARVKIEQAVNFGASKGLTFDRVLIKPTKKMEQYLQTGELDLDNVTLAKFYVAVTRARYSVAFISNIKNVEIKGIQMYYKKL